MADQFHRNTKETEAAITLEVGVEQKLGTNKKSIYIPIIKINVNKKLHGIVFWFNFRNVTPVSLGLSIY